MSHAKVDSARDQRGTLVIEFEVSARRAAQMALDDDPNGFGPDYVSSVSKMTPEPEPVRARVVISMFASNVDVYYQNLDPVGAPNWERWSDGLSFHRVPGVTLWRRIIVAEAFRRLATEAPRQIAEAPTGARVIDLGVM